MSFRCFNLHPRVEKAIAWTALVYGLLVGVAIGFEVLPAWSVYAVRAPDLSLLLLVTAALVLAGIALLPPLRHHSGVQRVVGSAFFGCWGAGVLLTGHLFAEPPWQQTVRLTVGVGLGALALALALRLRWGVRIAKALVWWQVLYHFGGVVAQGWMDGSWHELAHYTTTLQLLLFMLVLRSVSQLDSEVAGDSDRVWGVVLAAAAVWGTLGSVFLTWILDEYEPLAFLVMAPAAGGLGLAWIAAGQPGKVAQRGDARLAVPKPGILAAAGRLAVCVLVMISAAGAILPQKRWIGNGTGRVLLGVLVGCLLTGVLLVATILVIAIAREILRCRRNSLEADEVGFRIRLGSETLYVEYVDCAWSELRPTAAGAELVLRSRDFRPILSYSLLSKASALSAARALQRCKSVRERILASARRSSPILARPPGASFGAWVRSLQDLARKVGHPYQTSTPDRGTLEQIVDDISLPSDERAGAAVALVTVHDDSALRQRLGSGLGPPLVTAAAVAAGADLPLRAFRDAVAFLDGDDRQEALGLVQSRRA